MCRDDQRGADLLRLERADLRVQRADARTLVVVEHRAADRAGKVVVGELRGAAHVEAVRMRRDRVDADRARRARMRVHRGAVSKRFERRPHVVEELGLRRLGRMDAIGLERRRVLAEALEEERHQRRACAFATSANIASNCRVYAGP